MASAHVPLLVLLPLLLDHVAVRRSGLAEISPSRSCKDVTSVMSQGSAGLSSRTGQVVGRQILIMPARVMAAEVAQGRLVPIPIAAPDLYRPLGIVHSRKKRFHRAAQAFLELLQEQPTAAFAGLT